MDAVMAASSFDSRILQLLMASLAACHHSTVSGWREFLERIDRVGIVATEISPCH